MNIQDATQGPDWAAFAPLIQAQQRAIAERRLADDASVADAARVTPTPRAALSATGGTVRNSEALTQPGDGLSDAEERAVEALKARDSEVRDHEQAHARVGGAYASEPSYSYQVGPDGKRYAVGGEVQIDVSPVPDDPAATITKMDIVKAAALAPAEPSSADRQVASLADAQRAQAMADLTALRSAERRGEVDQRV